MDRPQCILDLNQFADHYETVGRVSMPEILASDDSFRRQIINCTHEKYLSVLSVSFDLKYYGMEEPSIAFNAKSLKIGHETPGHG